MIELYQSVNSVCAQKVRIALVEKALPWREHRMTLRGDQLDPAYLKLNPNGLVPTLVHDGSVLIESTVILHYLDESFPEPPLMPASPGERARVRVFAKLVDEYVHTACAVLTFATAFRAGLARMERSALETQLAQAPDQKRSAFKRDVVDHGLDSAYVVDAARVHERLLAAMATALEHGPYLAGERYSVADIAVTPYILRLELLRLERMWEKRPGVAAWYERIKSRPAFKETLMAPMTDADWAPFKTFEPDPWPKIGAILKAA